MGAADRDRARGARGLRRARSSRCRSRACGASRSRRSTTRWPASGPRCWRATSRWREMRAYAEQARGAGRSWDEVAEALGIEATEDGEPRDETGVPPADRGPAAAHRRAVVVPPPEGLVDLHDLRAAGRRPRAVRVQPGRRRAGPRPLVPSSRRSSCGVPKRASVAAPHPTRPQTRRRLHRLSPITPERMSPTRCSTRMAATTAVGRRGQPAGFPPMIKRETSHCF